MLSIGNLFSSDFEATLQHYLSDKTMLDQPIFAALLLDGRHLLQQAQIAEAPHAARYVLFEYDRIYIIHDSGSTASPCIQCFLRHAVDAHPFPNVYELRHHYLESDFSYLFDASTLRLLPELLQRCEAGEALVYYPGSGEVLDTSYLRHPQCSVAWHTASQAQQTTVPLQKQTVGPSLRGSPLPNVAGFTSATGLIQSEHLRISDIGYVHAVTKGNLSRGMHESICGGVGRTPSEARLVARCEAAERFQVWYEPADADSVEMAYEEAPPHAINPDRLQFQLRQPSANAKQYTPVMRLSWTPAYSATADTSRLLPAQQVWVVPQSRCRCPHVTATTSGCAIGGSIEEAAIHAFFELVERDSFLTSWYLRRNCASLDPALVDDEHFQWLFGRMQLQYPRYDFFFFNTMTDLRLPAVWLLAVRTAGTGKKTITTGAAHLNLEHAMASALRELAKSMKPRSNANLPTPDALADDPTLVTQVADHGIRYESDTAFHHFDFLDRTQKKVAPAEVQRQALIPTASTYDLRTVLRQFADHLGTLGSELILKDLTLPGFGKRRLHCVRAFVPDAYPISFGYYRQRFAINDRLQRLARQYHGAPLKEHDVNPAIHPFA